MVTPTIARYWHIDTKVIGGNYGILAGHRDEYGSHITRAEVVCYLMVFIDWSFLHIIYFDAMHFWRKMKMNLLRHVHAKYVGLILDRDQGSYDFIRCSKYWWHDSFISTNKCQIHNYPFDVRCCHLHHHEAFLVFYHLILYLIIFYRSELSSGYDSCIIQFVRGRSQGLSVRWHYGARPCIHMEMASRERKKWGTILS